MNSPADQLQNGDGPEHDQFRAWIGYEVAAPILILLLAYFIAAYVFDLPHPFLSTFGSADILPVAALILLGSSAELDNFSVYEAQRSDLASLSRHRTYHVLLVLVLAITYGALKGKALLLLDHSPLLPDDESKLKSFSTLTVFMAVFAIFYAYYSKNKLLSIKVGAKS